MTSTASPSAPSAASTVARTLARAAPGLAVQAAPAALEAFRIGGRLPEAIAFPQSTEQAAQILALAYGESWGVVPWGAGQDMGTGRPPRRYHLALSLSRLAGIVDHDADNLTVTALAGLSLAETNRQLRPRHQFLALGFDDEPHTLGGLIAVNRPVPRRLLYGDVRDQLLGLTVATPDGRLVRYGRKVVKNVAGYDMNKLYTGSAGMLGVIVDVTLKLFALPDESAVARARFAGTEPALAAAAELYRSALAPAFLVLLDAAGGRAGLGAHTATDNPGLIWLCAGFEGRAAGLRRQTADALALMAKHRASDGAVLPELPPAARRWLQAPSPTGDAAGDVTVARAGVAPVRLGWLAGEVQRLAADPELGAGQRIAAALAADYGSGILRCTLAGADPMRLAVGLQRLRGVLESERGYLVLESAPAALAQQLDPWGELGGEAALMRVLRRQMDPREILVPGRFL